MKSMLVIMAKRGSVLLLLKFMTFLSAFHLPDVYRNSIVQSPRLNRQTSMSALSMTIPVVIANKNAVVMDLLKAVNSALKSSINLIPLDSAEETVFSYVKSQAGSIGFIDEHGLVDGDLRTACKYYFFLSSTIKSGDRIPEGTIMRLLQLIQRITVSPLKDTDIALDAGLWSHFLSLTYPTIEEAVPKLPTLEIGVDALELRVDLLANTSIPSLHQQIALLRENSALPIIFTVRSVGQIGKFPAQPDEIFRLLREGLRAGVDWIDVEACWPVDITDAFTQLARREYAATSRVLGSLHMTTAPENEGQVMQMFNDCLLRGGAHVAKVVTGAQSEEDCKLVRDVGLAFASSAGENRPYIGICLGATGSLSRVWNRYFTPVTHPLMAAAAPGQLSVEQLMQKREELALIVPKHYFLFGTPIQQSLSPAMHNGGFGALKLPYVYGLDEQVDVAVYKNKIIGEASFGGASVTIPHKESVITLIDETRGAAVEIGAVNTIVVEYAEANEETGIFKQQGANTVIAGGKVLVRRLIGYNTDWLGMRRPLERQLRLRGPPPGKTRTRDSASDTAPASSGGGVTDAPWSFPGALGVVIGAGGTAKAACYTVKSLGLDLIVCNRDQDKGRALAAKYGGRFVSAEELASPSVIDSSNVQVVISTVPAQANVTLPSHFYSLTGSNNVCRDRPVVLDVVYKPARTQLMQQALDNGCLVVQGATMLLEQGLEAFELWTQRRAPRAIMDKAIFLGTEKLVDS